MAIISETNAFWQLAAGCSFTVYFVILYVLLTCHNGKTRIVSKLLFISTPVVVLRVLVDGVISDGLWRFVMGSWAWTGAYIVHELWLYMYGGCLALFLVACLRKFNIIDVGLQKVGL